MRRGRRRQESELFQSGNLLCYTRERVKREVKEILHCQTTSCYVQFICLPRIIRHVSIYHLNPSPWSYTPPNISLSTKPRHISRRRNTSDHLLIATNSTSTTTPISRTLPPRLSTSLPLHNTSSFRTREPIPKYQSNLSLVAWAVTVSLSSVLGSLRTFPKGPGFLSYSWLNSPTVCNPSTIFAGSHVRESYPVHCI